MSRPETLLHPATETAFDRASTRLDQLEQMPVGPGLHAALVQLQSTALGSAAAVRASALWAKVIAHCQARSMVTTTEAMSGVDLLAYASGHDAKQIIGEELAAMTHVTSGTAINEVYFVDRVGAELPLSWEALDRGDLTLAHLMYLARATQSCGARVAQAVDNQLIPLAIARGWTPQKLAAEAARVIIRVDPDGAAERAEKAKATADVRLFPGQDETSTLYADGDAVTLRQVMDAIDARADQLGAPGAGLPAGLRRFNALADLVLGDPVLGDPVLGDPVLGERVSARPNVEVVLTMDLTTWLGLNQDPAELSGFGPITAETARQLAADAGFRRLITDPITAQTLDLGRDSYRPSQPLRRFVEARDRTCQFPGCARRATHCDIDHCLAYDELGHTDACNLHPLCRMHHNLKTKKLWKVDIQPDGAEIWTSPLGFTYRKPAATYPIHLLEPPDEVDLPEPIDEIATHDPDPPFPDEPMPTPPPLTDEEYLEFVDAFDRGFGAFADRAYDTLRLAGLIA
jgi:hypothetical protein